MSMTLGEIQLANRQIAATNRLAVAVEKLTAAMLALSENSTPDKESEEM